MKKDKRYDNDSDLNPDWTIVLLGVILSGGLIFGFFELLHSIAVATYT